MAKPKSNQPLVPSFQILINDTPLPGPTAAHVVDVTIDADIGLPSMFAIDLSGSDDQAEAVPFIDDATLFSIGNVVELKLGYGDQLDTVMIGELTGLEPTFAVNRLPNLLVRGLDRLHRLQRGRKSRTFTQQKDSDIAAQIANDAGLTPDVEDSSVIHDYVYQHNQSDFEFLRQRAARIGYELSIDDKTLHFRARRNADSAQVTLSPQDGLLEFTARLVSTGQADSVEVRGWSVTDKDGLIGQSKTGDEVSTMNGQSSGPAIASAAFGAAIETVSAWPVATQAEADQVAKARFNDIALDLIAGEGACQGRTDLKAGEVIALDGLGKRFSGAYYVTGVRHRYSSRHGYLTHFTARRNAS
jgi:phage protein D